MPKLLFVSKTLSSLVLNTIQSEGFLQILFFYFWTFVMMYNHSNKMVYSREQLIYTTNNTSSDATNSRWVEKEAPWIQSRSKKEREKEEVHIFFHRFLLAMWDLWQTGWMLWISWWLMCKRRILHKIKNSMDPKHLLNQTVIQPQRVFIQRLLPICRALQETIPHHSHQNLQVLEETGIIWDSTTFNLLLELIKYFWIKLNWIEISTYFFFMYSFFRLCCWAQRKLINKSLLIL